MGEAVWLARNHLIFLIHGIILSSNQSLLFDCLSVGVQCIHLAQLLLMLSLAIKRSYGNVWHIGVYHQTPAGDPSSNYSMKGALS